MHHLKPLSVLLLALTLGACATAPAVRSELPVERVVIYRNGVAYFERQGETRATELTFKVRPDHVGDFLASLAVMEHGGSSVRSASFPLKTRTAQPITFDEDGEPIPVPEDTSLVDVTLALDGQRRTLTVGYIAEQPVWKPSYRLVFENDRPTFQAWGIVQNISGEDWRDVRLSLVAGAPISFESTLGVPMTPVRPVITDHGEVISQVPVGESTLSQAPPPPSPALSEAPEEESARERAPMAKRRSMAAPAPEPKQLREFSGSNDFYDAPAGSGSMVPRDGGPLASSALQAGATRYDLAQPVTLPNNSATMVLLVAQEVPGASLLMFAPEPGVPDSTRHPFRVARFTNATQGLIEKGPLAVFEDGAFLGQGLLDALSSGGEAIVPFALDRGLAVEQEHTSTVLSARLSRIEHGRLTIDRDRVQRTTYRLRNGGDREAKVLVRHPLRPGMKLHAPPEGTEEQVGKGTALVPAVAPARDTHPLVIEERQPFSTSADWFSNEADAAVKAYLADPRANEGLAAALREAWEIRNRIVKARESVQRLRTERDIVSRGAGETRAGLDAISRSRTGVAELRARLSSRLIEQEKQLAALNQQLVAQELTINDDTVRFNELVRDLRLEAPLEPTGT